MKLPDISRGGRAESLGAERKISNARNFAHAIDALGDSAVRFFDARDEESFTQEKNDFLIEHSKFALGLRSPYQDPNNIPQGVSYEANEDKWVNGQKTTVARTQIPTHEVQTQWMDSFLAQADEKAKAKLSGGAYKKWQEWFTPQSIAIRTRNGVAQFDAAQAAQKARVGQTIEKQTDAGMYEDAIQTIAQSPYHTEAEKIKATEQIANEAEMRPIQDAAMNNDLATLQQERARLMDPNYVGVLDPDVRQRVVNFIDREVKRSEAEAESAVKEQQDKNFSDLMYRIDMGQAGIADTEKAYQTGRIDESQRTSARSRAMVMARRAAGKAEAKRDLYDLGAIARGEMPPPANTKEYRKQVIADGQALFGDVSYAEVANDPDLRQDMMRYSTTFKVVMPQLESYYESALYGDTNEAAEIAMEYAQMMRNEPSLKLVGNDPGTQFINDVYSRIYFNRQDPEAAVIEVKESMQEPPGMADAVRYYVPKIEEANKNIVRGAEKAGLPEYLWDRFDENVQIPPRVTAVYRQAYGDYMRKEGAKPEHADANAMAAVQSSFGVSNQGTSGIPNQFKLMPVDQIFGGSEMQLGLSISMFEKAYGLEPNTASLHAIPNQTSVRNPVYYVQAPNENGVLELVKEPNGAPVVYNPYEWPNEDQVQEAEELRDYESRRRNKVALQERLEELQQPISAHPIYGERVGDLDEEIARTQERLKEYEDIPDEQPSFRMPTFGGAGGL